MYTIPYIEHGETFELTPTTILPSYQHPLRPGTHNHPANVPPTFTVPGISSYRLIDSLLVP